MNTKVLILDSLAGIWPHSLQMLKVAMQLKTAEFELDYLTCASAAPATCTVQDGRAHTLGKLGKFDKLTCVECTFTGRVNATFLGSNSKGKFHSLSKFVNPEIILEEKRFLGAFGKDIAKQLNKKVAGTPVVRIALYEAILKFKKKDLNFNEVEFKYFEALLRNSVRFALLGKEFFNKNSNYQALLVYAPQYAMNHSFIDQASKKGVQVYFVDGSGNISERYSSVAIWDWKKYKLERPGLLEWSKRRSFEIRDEDLLRIENHRRQLADGRSFSVYSPTEGTKGIDLHQLFNIPLNSKVWTLALSSVDEAFAAQTIGAYPKSKYPGTVFRSQYEWVEETISWVAKQRDLKLIVRMHPRDLPNKRENLRSEQAGIWEALLKNLPPNVQLNHPSDEIPIKDLLDISDGFLTGWSSTAIEAMDLGIPVVTYDNQMPGFPESIHSSGKSKDEYFKNLEKLLTQQASPDVKRNVDVWLAFLFNLGSVRLTGRLFENLRLNGPKWFPRIFNALDILFPYFLRPLEALITVRKTSEGRRIVELVRNGLQSLYEVQDIPESNSHSL